MQPEKWTNRSPVSTKTQFRSAAGMSDRMKVATKTLVFCPLRTLDSFCSSNAFFVICAGITRLSVIRLAQPHISERISHLFISVARLSNGVSSPYDFIEVFDLELGRAWLIRRYDYSAVSLCQNTLVKFAPSALRMFKV